MCLPEDSPGVRKAARSLVSCSRVVSGRGCLSLSTTLGPVLPPGTVARVLGQRGAVLGDPARSALLHGEAAPLAVQEALVRVTLRATPALLA